MFDFWLHHIVSIFPVCCGCVGLQKNNAALHLLLLCCWPSPLPGQHRTLNDCRWTAAWNQPICCGLTAGAPQSRNTLLHIYRCLPTAPPSPRGISVSVSGCTDADRSLFGTRQVPIVIIPLLPAPAPGHMTFCERLRLLCGVTGDPWPLSPSSISHTYTHTQWSHAFSQVVCSVTHTETHFHTKALWQGISLLQVSVPRLRQPPPSWWVKEGGGNNRTSPESAGVHQCLTDT